MRETQSQKSHMHSIGSLKFWRSFLFPVRLNFFCTKGLQHQVNDLRPCHLCVDSLSPVHTLCNPRDQGKQFHQLNMDFYSCLYFYSDQSVSVVPKSRCVLRKPFKAGNEAEVSWRCEGEKQRFIGIILRTAKKGRCGKLCVTESTSLHVYIFLDLVMCRYFKFSFGASVTNAIILKLKLCKCLNHKGHLPVLN